MNISWCEKKSSYDSFLGLRFMFFLMSLLLAFNALAASEVRAFFLDGRKISGDDGVTVSIRKKNSNNSYKYYKESSVPVLLEDGEHEVSLYSKLNYKIDYKICSKMAGGCLADHAGWSMFNAGSGPVIIRGGSDQVLYFRIHQSSEDLSQIKKSKLTCNYPGGARISPDKYVVYHRKNFDVRIGVSESFGGILVDLGIAPKGGAGKGLNLIDSASAAGAAWQTSVGLLTKDNDLYKYYIFNQGAGNLATQWGFEAQVDESGKRVHIGDFPIYTDHVHVTQNRSAVLSANTSMPTSPCYNTALKIGSGFTELREIDRKDSNLELDYAWNLKFDRDFVAIKTLVERGLYINRAVAKLVDLNVYLVGEKGGERWVEGPIYLYDKFSITEGRYHKNLSKGCDSGDFVKCQYSVDVREVYFVLTIDGKRFVIKNYFPDGRLFKADLVLNEREGDRRCRIYDGYDCGNVVWHVRPNSVGAEPGDNEKLYRSESSIGLSMRYVFGEYSDLFIKE